MPKNLYNGSCKVATKLNFISGRWKLPILWKLSYGRLRYNELKRQVSGITNIMLTRSLQELEADGLVMRTQYPGKAPHVDYRLTEAGQRLLPALEELVKWAREQTAVDDGTSQMRQKKTGYIKSE